MSGSTLDLPIGDLIELAEDPERNTLVFFVRRASGSLVVELAFDRAVSCRSAIYKVVCAKKNLWERATPAMQPNPSFMPFAPPAETATDGDRLRFSSLKPIGGPGTAAGPGVTTGGIAPHHLARSGSEGSWSAGPTGIRPF
jgi:hypothetical protein